MSSATSTNPDKGSFRLKAEATAAEGPGAKATGAETTKRDEAFQAWHFFVLASLAAATAAVVMSRQATPAHLVLISVTIGTVGAAAAAFYRMLLPFTVDDPSLLGAERQSERARTALEREKALVLRSIKELEFDRAMGKLSPRDFDEMSARLRARAMMLIKRADEGGSGYRELIERELSARLVSRARAGRPESPEPSLDVPDSHLPDGRHCTGCRTENDIDAAFCKRCGNRLAAVIG